MEKAYSCDIVRNNNPKSKRFGQYGIVLTNGWNCNYINYQDGFTAYCNVKHLCLLNALKSVKKLATKSFESVSTGDAFNLLVTVVNDALIALKCGYWRKDTFVAPP